MEIANKGTLFLDEVDNLTLNMQAKILRFLQEKEIYHVGGDFAIPVNTRVIAATNQDPEIMVKENRMRKDLYYRLNVIEINVPPLRERKEDIPEISLSLIETLNKSSERGVKAIESVEPAVYDLLMEHEWPGNIRELNNVLERAFNRCYENELKLEHFVDFEKKIIKNEPKMFMFDEGKTLRQIKDETERYAIREALRKHDGNITKAADQLGISRQMLHRKMKDAKISSKQNVTVWRRA